ncbi:MAG: curli-like amyloid fiber formation chaperone CsgH [Actinomycetota bacterium]
MTRMFASLAAILLSTGVGFAAQAMVQGDGTHQGATILKRPACAIRVERAAGSVVLEGEVFAVGAASGSYQLRIWQNGAGTSQISQGGDFTVSPGAKSCLGLVTLPASGNYGAALTVTFDGNPVACKATARSPMPLAAK